MNTKWNALRFTPGLVGGHCIGVDPYYFVYEAEKLGYHSQIVLNGRKINDGMGKFVADNIIKKMINSDLVVRKSKVSILGLTFKENVPDTRNTKVIDIIQELNTYGVKTIVNDPHADKDEVLHEYGIQLSTFDELNDSDVIVFAVSHNEYKNMTLAKINSLFKDSNKKILIDIKSMFRIEDLKLNNFDYWRL
jgi:UDP-N-acetyl-D-galactosamine dehydrogenase